MPSSESYLEYCLSQMDSIPSIKHRKMMGEYLLYSDGVLVGGIYDDRLLLKETEAGRALMPDAETTLPYEGSKTNMLIVDCIDTPEKLCEVIEATAGALAQ